MNGSGQERIRIDVRRADGEVTRLAERLEMDLSEYEELPEFDGF